MALLVFGEALLLIDMVLQWFGAALVWVDVALLRVGMALLSFGMALLWIDMVLQWFGAALVWWRTCSRLLLGLTEWNVVVGLAWHALYDSGEIDSLTLCWDGSNRVLVKMDEKVSLYKSASGTGKGQMCPQATDNAT